MMEKFYTLIEVLFTWMCTFVKTNQTVPLISVHFTVIIPQFKTEREVKQNKTKQKTKQTNQKNREREEEKRERESDLLRLLQKEESDVQ